MTNLFYAKMKTLCCMVGATYTEVPAEMDDRFVYLRVDFPDHCNAPRIRHDGNRRNLPMLRFKVLTDLQTYVAGVARTMDGELSEAIRLDGASAGA